MNKPKEENSGCLWIFTFGFIALFVWVGLHNIFGLTSSISLIFTTIVSIGITIKWLGIPTLKGLIINIGVILSLIIGLQVAGNFLLDIIKTQHTNENFIAEEGVEKSILIEDNDSIPVYASNRLWRDNYGNNYEATLTVREKDYLTLRNYLEDYEPHSSGDIWGDLYQHIDKKDRPNLDLVMEAFQAIHSEKKLNQMEFAEMVVTCVQDIPYSFVFQNECLPADQYEPSIQRILEECPSCCLGNVPYGIQNPVSFLQNLKGDCDTRTVLIYSILKHFNYDVAILNSTFYRHSIIGVNLPAKGLVKLYKGKKYAVWETTAKYYEAGSLPSSFNDITHWDIVLTSK